jgi:prepilin-type N-terminal cleavage/methylation domain-containing protein
MFKKNKKGFTLIELMVVIAIIAILATVVLIALQNARNAAYDARIKSQVAQFRSLAETYFAKDQHYGNLTTDSEYTALTLDPDITPHLGGPEDKEDKWCVSGTLQNSAGWFCADNNTSPHVVDSGTGIVNPCTSGSPNCNQPS